MTPAPNPLRELQAEELGRGPAAPPKPNGACGARVATRQAAKELGEEATVSFLNWLRPDGPWTLTAIVPDGLTTTVTAQNEGEVRAFIAKHNGVRNLYYAMNPLRTAMTSKAQKTDVAAIEFILADLDPDEKETPEQAKDRYEEALENVPKASAIINSGNGLQVLWRLEKPIPLSPPINGEWPAESELAIADAECRSRAMMERLGAKAGTQNIDRILRLPGSMNLPNAVKKRQGRMRRQAKLITCNAAKYSLETFAVAAAPRPATKQSPQRPELHIAFGDLPAVDLAALPISKEIREAIDTDGSELCDGDRSIAVFRVACELIRAGCSDPQIASVLWSNPIGAHCHDQKDPERTVRRAIKRAREKVDVGNEFSSVESDEFVLDRGRPCRTCQHNIRLALRRLGVTVRHDVFQDRLLIDGLAGCGPLLDDHTMERLWLTVDAKFRFRPTKDFFWTVVSDEARRCSLHPVLDYLDSLVWDGKPRIDKFLSTYAGAKSTPYTDAVGALMLIAAVRRVRKPGCKFDEMPVLEGAQGTNKSTALRILAGQDDWFSDDLPLGNVDSKRVIEALAGRWIVEAAELNGMRKGDIDHLKAFLSRTHDRARMSYDRLVTEVARQCVIIGTTNSAEYLRDGTGNRRFWPVAIEQFDIEALRRDRDQLWAEAAARETQGESIRLRPSLWGAAADEQSERRIADPWEETIGAHLDGFEGLLRIEDAWKLVGVPAGQRTQPQNQRLGDAMRQAGWERTRRRDSGDRTYVYKKGQGDRWLEVWRDPQNNNAHVVYRDEHGDEDLLG